MLLREDPVRRPHVLGRTECPLDGTKGLTLHQWHGLRLGFRWPRRGDPRRQRDGYSSEKDKCSARDEFHDAEPRGDDVGNDSESFGACWRLRTLIWQLSGASALQSGVLPIFPMASNIPNKNKEKVSISNPCLTTNERKS